MSNYDYSNDGILDDYYEVLELEQTATIDEIRKNYLRLAKKYHPDHNDGKSEMFERVSKAYECLSKKESRKNYDLEYMNMHERNNVHNINYFRNEYNNLMKSQETVKLSESEIEEIKKKLVAEQIKDKPLELEDLKDKINNKKPREK